MKYNINIEALASATQGAVAKKTVVNRAGTSHVTFSTLKGKMSITSGAIELMDFNNADDTLVCLDMGKEFDAANGFRFAIAKGYIKDGKLEGASVNDSGQFNYTGIWAKGMFPDVDFDPTTKSSQFLAQHGLVEYNEETKRAKSFKTVSYELIELRDENDELYPALPIDTDSDNEQIFVKIYPLVNRVEKERIPNSDDDDEYGDSPIEGTEEV